MSKEFHTIFINRWSRVQSRGSAVGCIGVRGHVPQHQTLCVVTPVFSPHLWHAVSVTTRHADHEWNFVHKLNNKGLSGGLSFELSLIRPQTSGVSSQTGPLASNAPASLKNRLWPPRGCDGLQRENLNGSHRVLGISGLFTIIPFSRIFPVREAFSFWWKERHQKFKENGFQRRS